MKELSELWLTIEMNTSEITTNSSLGMSHPSWETSAFKGIFDPDN